ncbi:hypothetical protein CFY91_13580 [Pseudomonas fluvialis]|uniref:Cobalamin ABC transporter n=1 Tax=Pseudomonas fluvialis TaxID=1793966 RepID=A0ABQ2ALG2_9PSED|nr:hypothetical protein [Pseudomonas fluvialis]OXM39658.1 hypothetical protein CFY91_13580 [Pseudomonas fluvialis]GGH91813.1 hypothetical protein GCM10007363_12610 [Pseudomonas fluvialis]
MPLATPRQQWLVGLILLCLLLLTRGQHFATLNLPSASWAVYFVGGALLASPLAFAGLFAGAVAMDFGLFSQGAVSDWCLTPAYWLLLPAYASLWLGGRLYARGHACQASALWRLLCCVLGASLVCHVLSSGGFYFFSGHFADASLANWLPRIAEYYPRSLAAMSFYVCLAAVLYSLRQGLALASREQRWQR